MIVIADDILVFGEGDNDKEAMNDHEENLKMLLERCRLKDIKINRNKVKLRLQEVKYMGHILSKDGIKTDRDKVETINDMKVPTNVTELKRFLGMIGYLSKFIPNLSNLTESLRQLEKKDNGWNWNNKHDEDFKNLKKKLIEAPVLKYLKPNLPTVLQCDASKSGLGAVLVQEGQPIAYASRAMTETEQQYAQIEKECLAIVFGCKKFEQYIYGQRILVQSDHRHLETILKKPLVKAPKRLQRMIMQLQHFDLTVKYVPGKDVSVADALSREYLGNAEPLGGNEDQVWAMDDLKQLSSVNYVALKATTVAEIEEHSEKEEQLMKLKDYTINGWPEKYSKIENNMRCFFKIRDEISYENNIIFKGEAIIIPKSLQRKLTDR